MGSQQKHYLKINPYLDIISGIAVVLSFSDGIIKIIGREGSGKSVLTQLLAAELLEEDQEVVIFADIPHSEQELHDPISRQLHLNLGANSDFFEALNRHIQARPFDQQKLILVFDDADQIPDDCFAAIRHLFEKNYHDRPEVSMVFAGSELLDQKLNEPANRSFNKNIILNFEVKPMNRSELEAFCNAYLVEMGLHQKHRLSSDDLDDIFAETQGLPGKIPELIFSILDRETEQKKTGAAHADESTIIKKMVVVDDDPEPELTGLSVEDREEALTAYKDQIPWRWQSNGVGIAVVVLFVVIAYGNFMPEDSRVDSIVIFPPPTNVPGQLSPQELATLAETRAQQPALSQDVNANPEAAVAVTEADVPEDATEEVPEEIQEEAQAIAQAEPEPVVEAPEADTGPAIAEPESDTDIAVTPSEPVAPEPEAVATAETQTEPAEEPDTQVIAGAEAPADSPETPAQATDPEAVIPDPAPEAPPAVATETDAVDTEEAEPAPAPQVGLEPVSPTPAAPATNSRAFVRDWLQAWENQNTSAYLDAYSADFIPAGGMSLEAWRSDRQFKLTRPDTIAIEQEGFEIISSGNTETTVLVQFTYSSPAYADRTLKQLVLVAENGDWAIREERNISVETLTTDTADPAAVNVSTLAVAEGESGFEARIRQVLDLAEPPSAEQLRSPYGMFINDWLGAWKNQDVEGYFRHYADAFQPAQFDSLTDWRADRIRKINEKRFIEIAFDDIEVVDAEQGTARVRFWLSYASSFYLDRTLKEILISTGGNTRDLAILRERNLEVEIIPFYP